MVVKGGTASNNAVVETIAGEAFNSGCVHEDDQMEMVSVGRPVHDGLADGKFLIGRIIADINATKDAADDGVLREFFRFYFTF